MEEVFHVEMKVPWIHYVAFVWQVVSVNVKTASDIHSNTEHNCRNSINGLTFCLHSSVDNLIKKPAMFML